MKINLKEKTTGELKIFAYDLSKSVQQYSEVLRAINEEINARELEAALPKPKEQEKSPE